MGADHDVFEEALKGKDLPILTLDHRWHRLFAQSRVTPEIENLEKRVNSLLKRQGKVGTDKKGLRSLKQKLIDEILALVDRFSRTGDRAIEAQIERDKEMMQDCTQKLKEYNLEEDVLPEELVEANRELMLVSMEECSARFQSNIEEIRECNEWIEGIRDTLKEKIKRKQRCEVDSYEMFIYMRGIFGTSVSEIFDLDYNPEAFAPKKKRDKEA